MSARRMFDLLDLEDLSVPTPLDRQAQHQAARDRKCIARLERRRRDDEDRLLRSIAIYRWAKTNGQSAYRIQRAARSAKHAEQRLGGSRRRHERALARITAAEHNFRVADVFAEETPRPPT